MRVPLFCALLASAALFPGTALAALTLQAEVDRRTVAAGDSLLLTVRASGQSLPKGEPALGALAKDFEILGQGSKQQLVFSNGVAVSSSIWQYSLLPRREGTLTIPVIRFGGKGTVAIAITAGRAPTAAPSQAQKQQAQTPQPQAQKQQAQTPQPQARKQQTRAPAKAPPKVPAQQARPATTSPPPASRQKPPPVPQPKPPPHVFVESETDRKRALVQSQILYTQRVFSAIPIRGNIKPLAFRDKIPMREIVKGKKYQKTVRGRNYTVHEWVYALFPQKSGQLRLPPAELNATDLRTGRRMRKRSAALQLQVLPRPANAPGRVWLPARSVKLQEKWSADPSSPVNVGQPVHRTLEIIAKGLIAEQLPPLTLEKIPGLKIYPEKAHLETKNRGRNVEGKRREKAVLIPTRTAPVKLPAVELHWWNTQTNKPEVARLPAHTLQVEAGDDIVSDIQVESNNFTAAAGQVNAEDIDLSPPPEAAAASATSFSILPWIIASFGFGGAWLAFAFLWWREWSRRRQQAAVEQKGLRLRRLEERRAYRELESACQARDAAAARAALLKWMPRQWLENAPRNLVELAELGGLELRRALEKLDRALYGDSEDSYWDGTSLLAALEKLRHNRSTGNSPQPSAALPDLYG